MSTLLEKKISLGKQPKFSFVDDVFSLNNAVKTFGAAGDNTRGAFYTKREVVNFILDISGYTPDQPLYTQSLLDPCFGEGVFLIEAIKRLLLSARSKQFRNVQALRDCIRGVEISSKSFEYAKKPIIDLLKQEGFSEIEINSLLTHWLIAGDFLLAPIDLKFDYVVGNPPYVRIENIDKILLDAYRARFETMGNRSDLYIPFFERSLDLLHPEGVLGFICTDRWLKNQYGIGLREKINKNFYMQCILDLHHADPFETKVSAYPAIFLILNAEAGNTVYREVSDVTQGSLDKETRSIFNEIKEARAIKKSTNSLSGANWILSTPEKIEILNEIANNFPTLEGANIDVGIGVATGCDRLFILEEDERHQVEESRLLKLALRGDIDDEDLVWSGKYLVNTFEDDGSLINLDSYPLLKKYFLSSQEALQGRHVAQNKPSQWFRTIDKPKLSILNTPRLYIPDIMFSPKIAYTTQHYYPHHNLYWVTSNEWDVRAVKTLMKSIVGFLYIDTFSTRVRGGYYRYQAQTLKKIRIPMWGNVSNQDKESLVLLHDSNDFRAIDELACRVYNLSEKQKLTLFKENQNNGSRFSKLRENSR